MLSEWINRLKARQARRRRRVHTDEIVCVEALEHRQLLAAAKIQELPETAVISEVSLPLADYFDDPAISGSTARIGTPLGDFFVETYDTVTPVTAANFLKLATDGNYTDMFFHRSVPGFVLQGGGFTYPEGTTQVDSVVHNGSVINEFEQWFAPNPGGKTPGTPLNTRGTITMAKVGNQPDSATSQWFVNLADNSANLDVQNGGFTVFGKVLFEGMTVVDAIAALPRVNAGQPFDTLPVRDFESGGTLLRENLVTTTTTIVAELNFQITQNSNPDVVTAEIIDGVLRLTPVPGQTGFSLLTIEATDLLGNSVSSTLTAAIGKPRTVVVGPGDGIEPRPEITWQAVPAALNYDLWVDQVGGTRGIVDEAGLDATTFTPTADLSEGTYRVWVRVTSAAGKSGWSDLHTFRIGVERPAPVAVTSPSTSTVDTRRPVIEWTASETASQYDLWVNHVGVQNQVIRNSDLTGTSFTPSEDLADGTYRVWVRAGNSAGDSAWSPAVTFEVGTGNIPVITGPLGTSISSRPQITWSGSNSDTFELWVNQIGGTARIIHETAVTSPAFTPITDLPDGRYRAWVRIHPAGDVPGPWSDAYEFAVAGTSAPGATSLTDVTTDSARPLFLWTAAVRAVRYELWVNAADGTARVIHETGLTGTQFQTTADLSAGRYRAWIRAFNSDDAAGLWSNVFVFEV